MAENVWRKNCDLMLRPIFRRQPDFSRVTTFRGNRRTNSGGRRANNRLIANQFIFLDKQNKNKISTIIIFSV